MIFKGMIPALLVCLLLLPHTALAQRRGHADKALAVRKEILRLEELGRRKALAGDSNWDDLMQDGAYLIQGDGTVMIYHSGQNLSSMSLTSFKLSELIVRVYGQTAVATGLSEVASETPDKKPFSFRMRYLNVWKKTADGWKVVVAERTMVRPYTK